MRLLQRLWTRWNGREKKPDDRSGVILYTREGCHLCDDAKQILLDHLPRGIKLQEVDIDREESLQTLYGDCVPVVEIDGVVRFRGRINEVLLQRLVRKW